MDHAQPAASHANGMDSPSLPSQRRNGTAGAMQMPIGGGLQTPPNNGKRYGGKVRSDMSPAWRAPRNPNKVPETSQHPDEHISTSFPVANHEVHDVCEMQSPQLEASARHSTRVHTGQAAAVQDEMLRSSRDGAMYMQGQPVAAQDEMLRSSRDNAMYMQGEAVGNVQTSPWHAPALDLSADLSNGVQNESRMSPRSPFLGMDGRYTGRGVKPSFTTRRSGSAHRRSEQLQRNLDVMSLEMKRMQQRAKLAAE
mmetsp:Transcript_10635/g.19021  ORF Transcript_10635/g.19021 Transcript_10635/m.19021 type:complete len:253 (-) Transcript_10635:120-878(-)